MMYWGEEVPPPVLVIGTTSAVDPKSGPQGGRVVLAARRTKCRKNLGSFLASTGTSQRALQTRREDGHWGSPRESDTMFWRGGCLAFMTAAGIQSAPMKVGNSNCHPEQKL